MKKFFTLLCAAVMTLSTANAKLILTESFDREVGTLKAGLNTSMGSNTSDWWSYSGTSNYIKVDEGSLSYAGYKTTGEGNKADLWSTGADDFRQQVDALPEALQRLHRQQYQSPERFHGRGVRADRDADGGGLLTG